MSGRLRTAGLWLVGCVAVLVVTSLVASIGAPPRDAAPAPVQPAADRPAATLQQQDAGAAPAPRLKSLLEHYDLERLHEAGASTLTSSGLGTMDPSGYAAAREVLRGYGEALQQHIELTGVLRPRSAALQRLDALDQVSAVTAKPATGSAGDSRQRSGAATGGVGDDCPGAAGQGARRDGE